MHEASVGYPGPRGVKAEMDDCHWRLQVSFETLKRVEDLNRDCSTWRRDDSDEFSSWCT
jgi:hypothetical protein